MKKSRAYRAVKIKNVCLEALLGGRERQEVMVGLDISKDAIFAVVRWQAGEVERPWKIANPFEIPRFLGWLECLAAKHSLTVALGWALACNAFGVKIFKQNQTSEICARDKSFHRL